MALKSHYVSFNEDDWKCLCKYAIEINSDASKIIRILVRTYLKENDEKIKTALEKQKKLMESRHQQP